MELLLAGLALAGWVAVGGTVLARQRVGQRLRRDLEAVTAGLRSDDQPASAPPNVAGAMAALQRAAGAAVARAEDAERLAAALGSVLGQIPLGVVVSGPDGELLFRNDAADRLLGTRAADALALRAVSE
ncbi:MAG: hypothetical protein M3144_01195, partial [Actinomycetota bacterium]|nr:hypothetical protein [Actinomycetota bacterium]